MADTAFLGMRATNDFTVTGQRPKNWREMILRLYPNGKAPLTAILALAKSERTDDPEFNWFSKLLPEEAAVVAGVYSDSALTEDWTGAAPINSTMYIEMTQAEAQQFVEGHTVLLRSTTSAAYDLVALVTGRTLAGASSYLTVYTLQASETGFDPTPANINRILIIGSAHAEGAIIPEAVTYDPDRWYNYTQIFRNSLDLTRTAQHTRLRTGPAYAEAKRECLELHSIEMEKGFIFGVPSEIQGSNNKPLRTTGGLIWATKNGGGITSNFTGTWSSDGLDWLDDILMQIFRYGSQDKLAFVGDGALMGINQLAREKGFWQYTAKTAEFGINVSTLITPFGELTMKTHPLFSHEPTNRNSMLIFEPKKIRYRYITDTTFFDDPGKQGHNRYDGKKEEYLTEAGLEFYDTIGWGWLNSIGV